MTTATSVQLSKTQFGYARDLVSTVRRRRLSKRAAVITIEVALAESGLKMYANGNNADSLALPHDAVGWDHASVGLFQQQVPGWGTTKQLMDITYSGGKFLDALGNTTWTSASNWEAGQNVQNSAYDGNPRPANNWSSEYGGNYKAQDGHAAEIVNALWTPGAPGPETPTKYWVDIFERAPVFGKPGGAHSTGELYRGRNYVFGKRWGKKVATTQGYNHWWLKTVPDEGTGAWVSAFFLSHWGNDEAKDNEGKEIPNC